MDAKFLERKISEVEEGLRRAIPEKPEEVWEPIRDFVFRGGKRLRAVIPLVVAEELGKESPFEDAITLELFHNFTLIHDDIEDGSEMRRGKPCLHRIYPMGIALNAGDALYTLVMRRLAGREIAEKFVAVFGEVVEGQAKELWSIWKGLRLNEAEILEIAEKKTGALLGLAFWLGARGSGLEEDLEKAGRLLGLAFQIRDDVLNVIGDERYGKEIGGDLREGKRTLLVAKASETRPEVYSYLGKERVEKAIALLRETGAIEYAQKKAETLYSKALDLIPEEMEKTRALAEYIVKRKR